MVRRIAYYVALHNFRHVIERAVFDEKGERVSSEILSTSARRNVPELAWDRREGAMDYARTMARRDQAAATRIGLPSKFEDPSDVMVAIVVG